MHVLRLRDDLEVSRRSDGAIQIQGETGSYTIRECTSGMWDVLQVLTSGGATEDALADIFIRAEGEAHLAAFYYVSQRLQDMMALCYAVLLAGKPFVTGVPISLFHKLEPREVLPQKAYLLSRFALMRKDRDRLILESPLSHAHVVLDDPAAASLVGLLGSPRTPAALCSELVGMDEGPLFQFLELLLANRMLLEVGEDGATEEEEDAVLQQWDFHDLLFHARSRLGRHSEPAGAVYPHFGRIDPLPAIKAPVSGEVIDLYAPDLERLREEDFPFTLVLEERLSVRDYAEAPITLQQLGEFLYRTSRIRRLTEADEVSGRLYEMTSRPYPCGGASYELELYLTVDRCDGLESGLYHYDAENHKLVHLAERRQHEEELLRGASQAAAEMCSPQVLITLGARFQRMSWKYRGMAYAAILKNVGVLFQTMYLVATAMDLAPCALGIGNSEHFARATGLDYLVESSVGEFMLGSKRI